MLVAQLNEFSAVGIVRGADMVHAEGFHQQDALLDGPGIGGSTQCAHRVVVGIAFQQHLLAVQLQAEGRSYLHGAQAEMLFCAAHGLALLIIQRSLHSVEVRMLRVPQLRIGNFHLRQLLLHRARGRRAVHDVAPLVHQLPVRPCNLQVDRHLLVASARGDLYGDCHIAVVARSDIEWMAGEEHVLVGDHELHASVESSASVPSGVPRFTGVGHHGDDIVLSKLQPVGDIYLKAHIAIVRAPCMLPVHIDVARIHDAAEVEQQAPSAQRVSRREVQPVPPSAHLLESPARQSALDVGGRVVVVGLLVGSRRHPRLLYLEVMGQIHRPPAAVVEQWRSAIGHVAGMEAPAEVQALRMRCYAAKGKKKK